MDMRTLMEAVQPLSEIEIGGQIDNDHLEHLSGEADYTNPQRDLFPEIPTLDPHLPKGMKIVGKLGTFRVVRRANATGPDVRHNNLGEMEFVVFDRNKPIAWVALDNPKPGYSIDMIDDKFEGKQVISVYIDEEYRGKNLGVELYQWLLANVVDYLIADDLQTRGGVKLWKRLQSSRQFDVEVYDHEKYVSRRRRPGKDFDQVYHSMRHLVPWVTLRGKANRMLGGSDDE